MSEIGSLDQICEQLGILRHYRDHGGAVREVPEATLRSLVQCLNVTTADRILPPVVVWREGDDPVAVPLNRSGAPVRWIVEGDAPSLAGEVDRDTDHLIIGGGLPHGYYQLRLYSGDTQVDSCTLIAAPARAYLPPLLKSGGRCTAKAARPLLQSRRAPQC